MVTYGSAWHYGLSMFAEFETLRDHSLISISARFTLSSLEFTKYISK